VSECVFCAVVRELRRPRCTAAPRGGLYRKVRELPASMAILGHDQFYRGYTVVIAKTHALYRHAPRVRRDSAAETPRHGVGVFAEWL
jgi:hypothetical protein